MLLYLAKEPSLRQSLCSVIKQVELKYNNVLGNELMSIRLNLSVGLMLKNQRIKNAQKKKY